MRKILCWLRCAYIDRSYSSSFEIVSFPMGETEYGIGSIPLGGYVKMLGQDDDPRRMEEERTSESV